MKKFLLHLLAIIGGILLIQQVVFAAPVSTILRNVLPEANQTYDMGSTTPAREWNNMYTKNITISGTCTGCGSASLTGGSVNTLTYWTSATAVGATSSPTIGYLTATTTTATSQFLGNVSVTGNLTTGFLTISNSVTSNLTINGGTINLGASPNTATTTLVANGSGQLTLTAAGTNQNVVLTPSGTGYTLLNGQVGISSSTPWGLMSINPNALGSGKPGFVVGSSTQTSLLVDAGGSVGIATTSTYLKAGFGVATSTIFTSSVATNLASTTSSAATYNIVWPCATNTSTNCGSYQHFILNQNSTFNFNATSSGPTNGMHFTLDICNGTTGTYTATFGYPAVQRWYGITPATTTLPTTANTCTVLFGIYDELNQIYKIGSTTGPMK